MKKTFRILHKDFSAEEVITRAPWAPQFLRLLAFLPLLGTCMELFWAHKPRFVIMSVPAYAVTQYLKAPTKTLFDLLIVVAVALAFCGFFLACGHFAKAGEKKAFTAALSVYAADGLVALFSGNWLSVGLHAFLLFYINGIKPFCLARAEAEGVLATPPLLPTDPSQEKNSD